MIVLDYPRQTQTDSDGRFILIPPFHTGHLGFTPGTQPDIKLAIEQGRGGIRGCELIVSHDYPITEEKPGRAQVTCMMKDEPGVVKRLIDAISELGHNILVQESSQINHLSQHYVSVSFNLHHTRKSGRDRETRPSTQDRYRDYQSLFPIHDERFVDLFESIVTHCGDMFVWDDLNKRYLPKLSIRPLIVTAPSESIKGEQTKLHRFKSGRRKAQGGRTQAKQYTVKLPIPDGIWRTLCHQLLKQEPDLVRPNCQLDYMMLSDTDERVLRIFFPDPGGPKIFHIAIKHTDIEKALSTILGPIKEAGFNILTSLLRKHSGQENVWEAVLECKNKALVLPPKKGSRTAQTERLLAWVQEKLTAAIPAAARLNLTSLGAPSPEQITREEVRLRWAFANVFNFKLTLPRYPKPPKGTENFSAPALAPEPRRGGGLRDAAPPTLATLSPYKLNSEQRGALLNRREQSLLGEGLLGTDPECKLIQRVRENIKATKPTVFLSYPKLAQAHAKIVDEKLRALGYDPDEYQKPDAQVVLNVVLEKIRRCDYFVGIWHHEEVIIGDRLVFSVTPWMPFEYGVALAANKPCIVIFSNRLDPRITNRLNPDKANITYSDLDFSEKAVPALIEQCRRLFSQHPANQTPPSEASPPQPVPEPDRNPS